MQKSSQIPYTKGNKSMSILSFLILFLMFLSIPVSARSQLEERYTKDHPLIIVCDWNLPPYEYRGTDGMPKGFNVDVLHTILTDNNIPHKFIMRDGYTAATLFEQHKADIITDPSMRYNTSPYYKSQIILDYYKIRLVSNKRAKPIKTFEQLKDIQRMMLRSNDSTTYKMLVNLGAEISPEFHSVREILASLSDDPTIYFAWSEKPIKWKIKELNLSNIIIHDLEIPASEIHFASFDRNLIDLIDNEYKKMEANKEIKKLQIKWFTPEQVKKRQSRLPLYITLGILILTVGLLAVTRLMRKRIKHVVDKNTDMGNMMRQALSLGRYSVMLYNVKADRITNSHGKTLPENGYSFQEFFDHIHPEDQQHFKEEIDDLLNTKTSICSINFRWKDSIEERDNLTEGWTYVNGHAIIESDDHSGNTIVVLAFKNVTKEVLREKADQELANRFMKVFESTLVAMSFYDKNGRLIDLNENMRKLCGFDSEGEKLFKNTSLFDMPMLHGDLDPQSRETLHACQHMHYAEADLDSYLEFRIMPIYDGDELKFYIVTTRDITDERDMYMELYKQDVELHHTSDIINQYETQLHYLLENNQMWTWRSSLKDSTITFSRSLRSPDHITTFEEFFNSIVEEDKGKSMEMFNKLKGRDENYNLTLHFKKSSLTKQPTWFSISGIPLHDEDGQLTGHLGVIRDVSKLMEIQEKLKQETSRAEDSGKLKSVFLANMTHEIRTPLNAIVGFSDLLQMIDTPEERHEFIRIIRNNCDMLIRLINDIIEASNMNQGPLAIEAVDVDFAVAFNDICQTLAQRVQEPGVEFLVDNPYTTFPTHLDKGRLQQVITNFTTNAVKYTHQGHIKVGFRKEENTRSDNGEMDWGIYMYCEDTGAGIPKEKQASVFERFVKLNDYVQGTGLGLSICKSIADSCGGLIGVESEGEGHGSTFWIWIPCQTD